jgi:hypothetical protein
MFADGTDKGTVQLGAEAYTEKAIELWQKVCPKLEKALAYQDKLDTDSLPPNTRVTEPRTWFGHSKASYTHEIDQIIDAVLRMLEVSGAAECRDKIKQLQKAGLTTRL